MVSIANIPEGATLMDSFEGKMRNPDAWTFGKYLIARRWSAYRSMGFKTDYQQVAVQYIEVRVEGQRPSCVQYSGNHLELCQKHWESYHKNLKPWIQ